MLGALLTGVDGVGPLLVLRTANGSAGAVAVAIDQASWGEIIGTVAGEDTLLVITRSEKARERVARPPPRHHRSVGNSTTANGFSFPSRRCVT